MQNGDFEACQDQLIGSLSGKWRGLFPGTDPRSRSLSTIYAFMLDDKGSKGYHKLYKKGDAATTTLNTR
jgi:hypothetical protein